MRPYEENILRILTLYSTAQMPEISDWNPDGITEEDAQVIVQRNNLSLKIRESIFIPTLRVFEFRLKIKDGFVKRNRPEGGEDAKTIKD